jgi:hypothetical protein
MHEAHPIAEFAQRRIGQTKSWVQFLKQHAGVTDDIIAGIQTAVKGEVEPLLRESRCKYSKAETLTWFDEKVRPALERARSDSDFREQRQIVPRGAQTDGGRSTVAAC